jgi:hypothetical protein
MFWPPLSFYILAAGGLFAACLTMNLPETCDMKLPDTLEEAETFGLGQPFFLVPYLVRQKQKKSECKKLIL